MKTLLLFIAAIILYSFSGSPSPELYLGHATIVNKKNETCIVRPIYAKSLKEADSLFMALVKYFMQDTARLIGNNYDVWKVAQKVIVEKKDTLQLKPF